MSREAYNKFIEDVDKVLNLDEYREILLDLKNKFIETHISISEMDNKKDKLHNYYYEKALTIPIKKDSKENILDLIYHNKKIVSECYNFLSNKKLSIYQVKKVKKNKFMVSDIFNKKELITLPLTDEWFAIEKGVLIQSFMYYSKEPYFSSYGFIHPQEVKKMILKDSKEIMKNNYDSDYIDKYLARLFRKFVNSMRYSKKNPLEIYTIDL